jgi:hypothetical protein
MKALSCVAVSTPLPFLRADTTLLVPTSSPTGLAPATRSSIRSSTSCTFQRWSLRSSAIVSLR